ncbi:MAG TPA: HAD family phosphatase [Patescibacteria group bacterium]|nr:HAD family phosphatase [Patescibacteria group bacterium]
MKTFKAVFFDLGGVLSIGRRGPGVHEFVAKKLGMDLDQYLDSIDGIYTDAISGEISTNLALKMMASNLGTSAKKLKKIFYAAYRKNFRRDNTLYNLALNLKKKGYKIAIISDIWGIARDAILTKKDYSGFRDIITSYQTGARKISPKIFQIALKRLKVKSEEAIFTDNRKWNLTAPRRLGMIAILYKNPKQFERELKKLGIK